MRALVAFTFVLSVTSLVLISIHWRQPLHDVSQGPDRYLRRISPENDDLFMALGLDAEIVEFRAESGIRVTAWTEAYLDGEPFTDLHQWRREDSSAEYPRTGRIIWARKTDSWVEEKSSRVGWTVSVYPYGMWKWSTCWVDKERFDINGWSMDSLPQPPELGKPYTLWAGTGGGERPGSLPPNLSAEQANIASMKCCFFVKVQFDEVK